MWLVYNTSRKTYINYDQLQERINKQAGTLGAIWHQSIILLTYPYRHMGVATMASRSKDGEIISRVLKRLGFHSFRGSSSKDGGKALSAIIKYLTTNGIFATITVIALFINTGIVYSITKFIPPQFDLSPVLWATLAKAFATGFSMVWNFAGYKLIVFKK